MTKNNLSSSKLLSYSNRSLASSTTSIHKLKITQVETNKKGNLPHTNTSSKKRLKRICEGTNVQSFHFSSVPERKSSVPQTTAPPIPRRPSLETPKKGLVSSTKPDIARRSQSSNRCFSRNFFLKFISSFQD